MSDPYSILGVFPDATDAEIKAAYRELARKYHPDNYTDDNPLKDLAKEKMQQINAAYDEIQKMRKKAKRGDSAFNSKEQTGTGSDLLDQVKLAISRSQFKGAEEMLLSIPESDRVAEWHYLYSICLIKFGRANEAMRELEIACSMDPSNLEYQRAKEMFNQSNPNNRGYAPGGNYGNSYGSTTSYRSGRSTTSDACDCCANLICLDCLCECMGGDLIRCI